MRYLLGLMICVTTYSNVFGNGLTLGPGLSAKNALAYLAAMLLILESAMGRSLKIELRALQICFAVLIGYAALTVVIASGVVKYERYDLIGSIIQLKSSLLDWAVFFLAFFYGTRTAEEAEGLIKVLLIGFGLANVYTIANVVGVAQFGLDTVGFDVDSGASRVNGVFGHANETGTLITCLLPAYIPVVESARGYRKYLWIALMMSSAVVLFMTGSRGALVGLLLGGVWAAIICRRYMSWRKTVRWASIILGILIPITIFVGVRYWDMLVNRFTDVSLVSASDVTSGRTDIWAQAFGRMMANPATFITGYGWNVWSLMGFDFVAHNQYVSIWFELGLIGLISFIMIFRYAVVTALSAAAVADAKARSYMVAFVFGMLGLCASLFFATLFIPWFFIWPFVGLSMRYAVSIVARRKQADALQLSNVPPTLAAAASKRRIRAGSATVSSPNSVVRR